MKRSLLRAGVVAGVVALALSGCSASAGASSTGTPSAGVTTGGASSAPPAAGGAGGNGCSGGLKGGEPGVVRIDCDGPAEIRIQAGGVSRDLHGGTCRSAGNVWSAQVGVVIDATGVTGTYTGPPVESVSVNNQDAAGKGTIQAVIAGKHYFADDATLQLSADRKTAHLEGVSHPESDAPGARIVIDVTC